VSRSEMASNYLLMLLFIVAIFCSSEILVSYVDP
jgi:hypothetical protein